MSWCWNTTKYGEQEDGTFHFSIPDDEIRQQYIEDEPNACDLMEDMHCNSGYEYTTPVNIMVRSITIKFDIFAYMRKCRPIDLWVHLYNSKESAPKEAIIIGLSYDCEIIIDFDTNDDGDIIKVHKVWLLPEGWSEKVLSGETVICPLHKKEGEA